MPSWSTLSAFAAATIVLLLIPGPAVLYTLNRSIADGRRVGLAAVAGLELGDLIQATAAALGLSAVLATSAAAFSVVKWAGAAYLIVTGLRTLRRAPSAIEADQPSMTARRAFRQGVIVNALNPKTALFFLSIFPQFVDTSAAHAVAQSIVLGALFVVLATVFNSAYSLTASALRHLLLRGRALGFVRRYVSGSFFIGLGVLAAGAGRAHAAT
ncbi:MAG: LysE family translocator [Acidimicrobiales bacterium]